MDKKLFPIAARFSELVYQDPADIEAGIKELNFNNFKFIENPDTDTQCFVCSQDDFVFVTFRGTTFDNWEDWKTNLDFELVPCPFGRVHKGFWTDVLSVESQIHEELHKRAGEGKRLVVTGQSQGAGDAMAFAVKMLSDHWKLYAVPHFGGPRTVDDAAAAHLDRFFPDLFHRFVNNNDIVTRVPPRSFGYKHFGQLHYFKEDGTHTEEISAWQRFLDRLRGRWEDIGEKGMDMLKDHSYTEYTRLCRAAFAE